MKKLSSYPKVYVIGHRTVEHIFDDEVIVEEKIDGSQFSFGVIDGVLYGRSRKQEWAEEFADVQKLFKMAWQTALSLKDAGLLQDGVIYRGEAVTSPRHNVLKYDRIPKGGFILWDVMVGPEYYVGREEKEEIAERLGLEIVPILYRGKISSLEGVQELLKKRSCLGDTEVEGVVFKNYYKFDPMTGKPLIAKLVSDKFKERHSSMSAKGSGKGNERHMVTMFATEARWNKAIQHLREEGRLNGDYTDIGPLIGEISRDLEEEEKEEIKEMLWKLYGKRFIRDVVKSFPSWYKEHLMQQQKFS